MQERQVKEAARALGLSAPSSPAVQPDRKCQRPVSVPFLDNRSPISRSRRAGPWRFREIAFFAGLQLDTFSFSDQLPQECRVTVLHRQLKVSADSPSPGSNRLARERVFRWPVVFLPVQSDASLLPSWQIIEIDTVTEKHLVFVSA
jgi:hypothetical protein